MSKTILITGAGSGFGHGVALGLAKKGHQVIATCESWPQVTQLRADAKAEDVSANLTVEKLDYRTSDDVQHIIEKYANEVDVFAPNAATGETGPIAEIDVDRVRSVFEVNVFRTLELIQGFAKAFVARGSGKIIPTSSIAGFFTFDFLAPYCASKHALEAIVQTLYGELKGTGVQVATINPGPFRTGFNDRMYDTLDQWYDPEKNFTEEKPIRDVQQLFEGNDLQLDPQSMIDFMIETIPADEHPFRNVHPEGAIGDTNSYQKSIYEWTTSPEQEQEQEKKN